jgi:hypothetical protein
MAKILQQPDHRSDCQRTLRRQRSLLRPFVLGVCGSLLGLLPMASTQASPDPTPFTPMLAQFSDEAEGDIIIYPPIWPYPPVITAPRRQVRVQFVAEGQDWGAVYLDNRLIYQPLNFNRRREFRLDEGAYYLEVTGVARTDIWDSGYLDVGRADANILVVVFSKTAGVRVLGDPNAWIPDGAY